jgi:hypothetical protein
MDLIFEEHEALALVKVNCPPELFVKTFLNRRDENNWLSIKIAREIVDPLSIGCASSGI